jgi:hypothetical protein
MLAITSLTSTSFAGAAMGAPRTVMMEAKADLESMAQKLNPVVGFWDPLGFVDADVMGDANSETIGYLREAEIKHGRVAMAAFVGFCVQSNGIHFPWSTTLSGVTYESISAAGSPCAQWDALPTNAKWQIFMLIGLLEMWGECARDKHYMKGGQPGKYPSFEPIRAEIGHPTFDLFDPFGFSKNKTPEQKERGLLIEINNARLAQIGIMAFVSEARIPGSVPGLANMNIAPYDGDCMAPWAAGDAASVPNVAWMLEWQGPWGAI